VWNPRLFTSRNRMRWHFLSHKFGRLILPWTLLAAVAASWVLPQEGWRTFFLWGEIALGGAALLDTVIPRGLLLKRLTSPLRTFLLMNAAALAALAVFFVPAQWLWKPTKVATLSP